jgi:predicted RNA-binding protein YlqC (UPF0109 family)
MSEQAADVRALIEHVAKALVDAPDQVCVAQLEEEGTTVLELKVAPNDLGKVIGRSGRNARAMRILAGAVGMKSNKHVELDILE